MLWRTSFSTKDPGFYRPSYHMIRSFVGRGSSSGEDDGLRGAVTFSNTGGLGGREGHEVKVMLHTVSVGLRDCRGQREGHEEGYNQRNLCQFREHHEEDERGFALNSEFRASTRCWQAPRRQDLSS